MAKYKRLGAVVGKNNQLIETETVEENQLTAEAVKVYLEYGVIAPIETGKKAKTETGSDKNS